MDLLINASLLLLGIAAGLVSALVGGASLITFPVLLGLGLSPLTAAVANTVALTPGNILAWVYDRRQLPPFDRSFVVLIAVSLAGALLGAVLLVLTPIRVLSLLVPLLLGFATLVFAGARQIESWIARRAAAATSTSRWGATNAALFPVSVYGGYFGSGVGVLLLAVLSIGSGGDYRATNVLKNFITSLNSAIACGVYIMSDVVVWAPALAMMVGALAGALAGARIARTAPREGMKKVVIALATALTLASVWHYWL